MGTIYDSPQKAEIHQLCHNNLDSPVAVRQIQDGDLHDSHGIAILGGIDSLKSNFSWFDISLKLKKVFENGCGDKRPAGV